MLAACGCSRALNGLYGTTIGGQPVTSTSDPVGTPVTNAQGQVIGTLNASGGVDPISSSKPAPQVQQGNAQIAPSVVPWGTPSSSPSTCDVNEGYSCQGLYSQPPAGSPAPSSALSSSAPTTETTYAPVSAVASSDVVVAGVDLSQMVSQYWVWILGAGAALFLMSRK